MPYMKYKIYKDSKCPACGNHEYIKLPKSSMMYRFGNYDDSDVITQPFPAICSACGCMFIVKDKLQDILSSNDLIEHEDKKEIQSQNSVDEF